MLSTCLAQLQILDYWRHILTPIMVSCWCQTPLLRAVSSLAWKPAHKGHTARNCPLSPDWIPLTLQEAGLETTWGPPDLKDPILTQYCGRTADIHKHLCLKVCNHLFPQIKYPQLVPDHLHAALVGDEILLGLSQNLMLPDFESLVWFSKDLKNKKNLLKCF